MAEIKRIDIAEFRSEGYLQELNRQFLHPHGLALEVVIEDDGTEHLGGVWDYRDDSEGILYEQVDLVTHANHIKTLSEARFPARVNALGYFVQPASES